MNTITIRQAILADIEALVLLFDGYRQFYGRPSDIPAAREFLLSRFNHGESILFIAHEGQIPIGFTQLYPSFSSVSLARVFVLNDLFVQEQARRKGVASKLLVAAIEFAKPLSFTLDSDIKPSCTNALSSYWLGAGRAVLGLSFCNLVVSQDATNGG